MNVTNLVHPALSFFQCCEKIGAFIVYSLSFNLADLNWPEEQYYMLDICGLVIKNFFADSNVVLHDTNGLKESYLIPVQGQYEGYSFDCPSPGHGLAHSRRCECSHLLGKRLLFDWVGQQQFSMKEKNEMKIIS